MDLIGYKVNALGAIIRMARERTGLSLRKLAKISGVSHTQIMRLEKGAFDTTIDTFFKISIALGLPPGRLLEDSFFVSFSSYKKTIEKDALWIKILKEEGWNTIHQKECVTVFLSSCCSVGSYLLYLASPVHFARRITYPIEKMKPAYLHFARNVEDNFTPQIRLSMLSSLRVQGFETLSKNGLCNLIWVREYQRLSQNGPVEVWHPFFNEYSAPLHSPGKAPAAARKLPPGAQKCLIKGMAVLDI